MKDRPPASPGSCHTPSIDSPAVAPERQSGVLHVSGAREHNLKNVDLEIPRDALVVFTGLSGSGKSSLAFDTIYAEGQRRYVESLSAYARQFLGQMDKPDVDFIEGLSPAISIDQKSTSKNPRSTVGTITEVYDYLRLLFARIGVPHCPVCGRVIARQSAEQITDQVEALPEGTRFLVLAPVVRGKKGNYKTLLKDLASRGYARARITSGHEGPADHRADRRTPRTSRATSSTRSRSSSTGWSPSPGCGAGWRTRSRPRSRWARGSPRSRRVPEEGEGEPESIVFSEHLACPYDNLSFEALEPRSFSFNTPYGACETCDGLGVRLEVDPDLVVGDQDASIDTGVLRPALDRRPLRVLGQPAQGGRGGPRVHDGHAVEPHQARAAARAALRPRRPEGHGQVHQPLRPRAHLPGHLRGRHPAAEAPPRRDRLRVRPGEGRGVHARGALPRVRGRPPAAAAARRHRRRQVDRRGRGAADLGDRDVPREPRAAASATGSSASASCARSAPGCSSCSTSGWTT